MNHALDVPKSNASQIHWQMVMAAREYSRRYALWLELCENRWFGWNKRTVQWREIKARHKPRFWTKQQQMENYHD